MVMILWLERERRIVSHVTASASKCKHQYGQIKGWGRERRWVLINLKRANMVVKNINGSSITRLPDY